MTENEAIEILEERWRYSKTYKYTDAEIREAFDMAIKALEQESCEDCISRQEALSYKHIVYDDDGIGYSVVRADVIAKLPSVQPTRPTGKWIEKTGEGFDAWAECSKCGCVNPFEDDFNYCPNCGARMEG